MTTGQTLDTPGETDAHKWVLINRGPTPMLVINGDRAAFVQPGFGIAVFGSDIRITNTEGRNVRFEAP